MSTTITGLPAAGALAGTEPVPVDQAATVRTTVDAIAARSVSGGFAAATIHTHTASQITDFLEAAQDVIGASLTGAGPISTLYDDPTGVTFILFDDAPSDGLLYARQNGAWANIAASFLPLTGGIVNATLGVSNTSGDANFIVDGPAGGVARITMREAGVQRWRIEKDGTNLFSVRRANVGGTLIDRPISVSFGDGHVTLASYLDLEPAAAPPQVRLFAPAGQPGFLDMLRVSSTIGWRIEHTLGDNFALRCLDPAATPLGGDRLSGRMFVGAAPRTGAVGATDIVGRDHIRALLSSTSITITGPDANGVVNLEAPSGGSLAFTDLTDVPPSYTGAANQILRVNSTADGIVFAAASAVANLPITFQDEGTALGSAGTVNVVNFTGPGVTATRTGDAVEVAVTGGGSSALEGYVDETWINPFVGTVAAGSAIPANTISLIPFRLERSITIDGLGARVTTSGATNCQLAIYGHNVATGRPTGNALIATGNLSVGTTGLISETPLTAVTLSAGTIYWAAANLGAGGPIFQSLTGAASSTISNMIGSATLANISSGTTATSLHLRVSQTFGTWPDLTSASFTETTGTHSAIIFLRISALP